MFRSKRMKRGVLAAVVCCGAVVGAVLAGCGVAGPSQAGEPVVVWTMQPIVSGDYHDFMDANIVGEPWSYYSEIADDFVLSETATIRRIRWWGNPDQDKGRHAPPPLPPGPSSVGSRGNLDCADAIIVSHGWVLDDTNEGAPSAVDVYGCGGGQMPGPEVPYRVFVPFAPASLSVTLTSYSGLLRSFLLESCDESDCLAAGAHELQCDVTTPGWYTLVVDRSELSIEGFELDVSFVPEPAVYFYIRIYEHDSENSCPGELLYEYTTTDYHEAHVSGLTHSYWADVPAFRAYAGERYWISIVAGGIPFAWNGTNDQAYGTPVRYAMSGSYIFCERWQSLEGDWDLETAFELLAS
jgi:hypothetical protein